MKFQNEEKIERGYDNRCRQNETIEEILYNSIPIYQSMWLKCKIFLENMNYQNQCKERKKIPTETNDH